MRRVAIRILVLLLVSASVWEAWQVLGPRKERPFWERHRAGLSGPGEMIQSYRDRQLRGASRVRVWTDVSGRAIEAVATAADERTVQLRVIATQTVYSLPLERLSEADREFVAKWRTSRSNPARPEPSPPAHWPALYEGGGETAVNPVAGATVVAAQVWRTPRYELRSYGSLDPGMLRMIASICESIDGACRAVPLPMLWGRPSETLRVIAIHPDEASYLAAGGLPGTAGVFIPATGEVLICEPTLHETDFLGLARGFSLEKRRRYNVLVHELVHQASIGITTAGFPAWVSEGLAEYFSATQRSPGRFQFRDSHLAVKTHAVGSLPFDGLVELQRYPVWKLENFLDRDLAAWNRITANGTDKRGQAWIQYFQALAMVEYFCRGDSPEGRRFRSYLEAVLTGAAPSDAALLHLLAGRSHAQVEQAISAYWRGRGLTLDFVDDPSITEAGARLGVGLESGLSR